MDETMRRLMMLVIASTMALGCAEVHTPTPVGDAGAPMGDSGPTLDPDAGSMVLGDAGPVDPCIGEILTADEACAELGAILGVIDLQVRERDSSEARCAEDLYVCPFTTGDYIEAGSLMQCAVGLARVSYCDDLELVILDTCPSFVLTCD